MINKGFFSKIAYGLLLIYLFPKPAHAYLDPGTGSYLIQIFVATLFGSLFFLKSIIRKISEFISSHSKKEPSLNTDPADEN